MFQNRFNFVFFFSADEVRGWFWKVRTMFGCFMIWCEKVGVEDIVNFPIEWELESVRDGSQDFGDWKWPLSFCGDFLIVTKFEVLRF